MANLTTLDMMKPNSEGIVIKIDLSGSIEHRLRDLGIIENTKIKCVAHSPLGDPKAYLIRGAIIALRQDDARHICVELINDTESSEKTLLLAGNPNVGKSTLFNALTGLNQHTGNWTGKTVSTASGHFETDMYRYKITDLPGTYSLDARSPEEAVAKNAISNANADAIIVVCDATNLEHSLCLVLQTIEITNNVIVCVNLLDEAKRRGIEIDLIKLQELLGVATVGVTAREKDTLKSLTDVIDKCILETKNTNKHFSTEMHDDNARKNERILQAEEIASICTKNKGIKRKFGKVDVLLTSKAFGYPVMLILLLSLFWLTIAGANYPSKILSGFLISTGESIRVFLTSVGIGRTLTSIIIDGIYGMTAKVISVMLPPMAIFFPLFTFLEDLGYLPRVAFNLDRPFRKCNACGKQALTMCMGFGCNACGVTGARIIDSPRERLLAIITNSFVPCNGRFPTIIAIIGMFLIGSTTGFIASAISALILTLVIMMGILLTFVATKLLSATLLKGEASSFALELPPYRKPQVAKIVVRSILDRTIFVLGRAIAAAAPSGLLIWILANIDIEGISILRHCTDFIDPFARVFGLDGVILTAFILGSAANETVIPIMIMSYLALGSPIEMGNLTELKELLTANNWTLITAVCTTVFTLLHWPCTTTLLTVYKETGSRKCTLISALLPTIFGLTICFIISTLSKLL